MSARAKAEWSELNQPLRQFGMEFSEYVMFRYASGERVLTLYLL